MNKEEKEKIRELLAGLHYNNVAEWTTEFRKKILGEEDKMLCKEIRRGN